MAVKIAHLLEVETIHTVGYYLHGNCFGRENCTHIVRYSCVYIDNIIYVWMWKKVSIEFGDTKNGYKLQSSLYNGIEKIH